MPKSQKKEHKLKTNKTIKESKKQNSVKWHYRILTLADIHKEFIKTNGKFYFGYYWPDGGDPNKSMKDVHKYYFAPNGNLFIRNFKKNTNKIITGYLANLELKLPYTATRKKDNYYALEGRLWSEEPGNEWKVKKAYMQICVNPANSMSDTCISGHNWIKSMIT